MTLSLADRIEQAERQAASGCGLSDILYEGRVQAAYRSILELATEGERAATEAALRARGFDPDFVPYEANAGECPVTGIDENSCPCGRHE